MNIAFDCNNAVTCDGTPLQQLACEMAVQEMVMSAEKNGTKWAATEDTLHVVRFKMWFLLTEAAKGSRPFMDVDGQ